MENGKIGFGKIKRTVKKASVVSIGLLLLGSSIYLGSFAENIKGNVDVYLLKKEKANQEKILNQKIDEEFRAHQFLKQKIKERENQTLVVEQKICEIAILNAKNAISKDKKIDKEDYQNADTFCHDKEMIPKFMIARVVRETVTETVFVEDGWQDEIFDDLEANSNRDNPF